MRLEKCIIPIAGIGSRMSIKKPKSLLEIDDTVLLGRSLNLFIARE